MSQLLRLGPRRTLCVPAFAGGPASDGVCPSHCGWARVGRWVSQLLRLGPRRVPPARLLAHRGFPPPGDELCVELGSDRWATGLVPSGLRLCGVLRGAPKKITMFSADGWLVGFILAVACRIYPRLVSERGLLKPKNCPLDSFRLVTSANYAFGG